jgi:hypothetical protein
MFWGKTFSHLQGTERKRSSLTCKHGGN